MILQVQSKLGGGEYESPDFRPYMSFIDFC